ncbi:hypothetical protein VNO77_32446 [Canavalia gladiata]|uniref:Uncharacterized protein n=1 Tax=Canavalia gladiata TaxID=3824 RepID=A0AAN9KUB4_CANGL
MVQLFGQVAHLLSTFAQRCPHDKSYNKFLQNSTIISLGEKETKSTHQPTSVTYTVEYKRAKMLAQDKNKNKLKSSKAKQKPTYTSKLWEQG